MSLCRLLDPDRSEEKEPLEMASPKCNGLRPPTYSKEKPKQFNFDFMALVTGVKTPKRSYELMCLFFHSVNLSMPDS